MFPLPKVHNQEEMVPPVKIEALLNVLPDPIQSLLFVKLAMGVYCNAFVNLKLHAYPFKYALMLKKSTVFRLQTLVKRNRMYTRVLFFS